MPKCKASRQVVHSMLVWFNLMCNLDPFSNLWKCQEILKGIYTHTKLKQLKLFYAFIRTEKLISVQLSGYLKEHGLLHDHQGVYHCEHSACILLNVVD